jgi:hypothetical protein
MLADDRAAVEDQVVARDQARLARNLLDTLDERQRDVLKLRWDLQLSGAEVRDALGLSRRQYQRLAEEGAVAIAERVEELENGTWSRRQRSLLAACLVQVTRDGEQRVGIATDRQRDEAQRLLESDPHVAALYVEVRNALKRATALLPLPVLVHEDHASAATRLAEIASDARDQLTGLLQAAKHQTTSLYIRAADPSLLSTPRPGTLVALAGCLVATGGTYTTYEALSKPPTPPPTQTSQPINPVRDVTPKKSTAPRTKPSTTKSPRATRTEASDVVSVPTVQAEASTTPPAPQNPPANEAPSSAEFGFED